MDAKEIRKMNLLKVALIVAVIVILCMGLEIYENSKVEKNSTENTISNNLEDEDVITLAKKQIDNKLLISDFLNETIILEGEFTLEEPCDVGYKFYKDGRVEYSGNISVTSGTYTTVGKDEVKIVFNERTIWEDEGEIHNKINEEEVAKVIDENTIIIDIESDGEIYSNKWVKVK